MAGEDDSPNMDRRLSDGEYRQLLLRWFKILKTFQRED